MYLFIFETYNFHLSNEHAFSVNNIKSEFDICKMEFPLNKKVDIWININILLNLIFIQIVQMKNGSLWRSMFDGMFPISLL